MIKVVLVFLIPIVIVGLVILLYNSRLVPTQQSTSVASEQEGPREVPLTTEGLFEETPQPLPSAKNNTAEERIKALEETVVVLNKKIDVLTESLSKYTAASTITTPLPVTTSSTTTSMSNGAKSTYIPIGYGGSTTSSSDFASLSVQEVIIDTANYPGYKQAVLEVNFRVANSNGEGMARLLNITDGTAVLNSLIKTNSGTFSTISSGGFNLTSGSKKYTLQLKSLSGSTVDVQLARIRIDF